MVLVVYTLQETTDTDESDEFTIAITVLCLRSLIWTRL